MFYLTFNTGTVTVSSIVPTDPYIYSTDGTYTFTFTPQHALLKTYTVVITIPNELEVQQNSACIMYGVDNEDYSCGADATANTLTLINFLSADKTEGDVITFSVDSIRNPADYITPGLTLFKISTADGGDVDEGDWNSWQDGEDMFTYSYITDFKVKAESYVAGDTPVTYKFTVTPYTKVAKGAILVLEIPPELEIESSQQLTRACPSSDFSGFTHTAINCQYNKGKSQITVTNGFKKANSVESPPTLVFEVSQFKNPRSLAPISMFNVTIYNENMKPLFYFNSSDGPTVVMTGTGAPAGFGSERS